MRKSLSRSSVNKSVANEMRLAQPRLVDRIPPWRTLPLIDVLVIGSGAAGPRRRGSRGSAPAHVSQVATKTTTSGEQLLEGAGRHPGRARRRRLAGAPRRGRHPLVPRHRRPAARRRAHVRGCLLRSPWLEEQGCSFTRENGGYRLARCGGATRKRLLQVGDRTGHAITKALRESFEAGERRGATRTTELTHARAGGGRLACELRRRRTVTNEVEATTVVLASGGSVLRRGRGARRALDEPSQRDR